ncbi:MAG TPA: hypothetical protein VNW28_00545 [Chthoniobacterales bacterium]|nr:hypothetical protein [Chthoniobacterales bacterium]
MTRSHDEEKNVPAPKIAFDFRNPVAIARINQPFAEGREISESGPIAQRAEARAQSIKGPVVRPPQRKA